MAVSTRGGIVDTNMQKEPAPIAGGIFVGRAAAQPTSMRAESTALTIWSARSAGTTGTRINPQPGGPAMEPPVFYCRVTSTAIAYTVTGTEPKWGWVMVLIFHPLQGTTSRRDWSVRFG